MCPEACSQFGECRMATGVNPDSSIPETLVGTALPSFHTVYRVAASPLMLR
jgi:hypothetical protein